MTDTKWRNRITGTGEESPDQLLANPLNFRIHPKGQQAALEGSLDTLGWVQTVLVNQRTGNMIDGHLRVAMALRRGEKSIPVTYVDLDEAEEAQALLSLDPIAAMAATDRDKLDELLRQVQTDNEQVQSYLSELAEREGLHYGEEPPEDPGAQIDKAEELREKWGVETGQLWQLGEHRLICGDCTDRAVVEMVMDGENADMIQTDPPYGVDYSGQNNSMFYGKDKKGKERERIEGDLSVKDAIELVEEALSLNKSNILFLWHAPQYHENAKEIMVVCGYDLFSVIVWNKNHANFGAMGACYKPKFEMALACKRDVIPWFGPDNEVTVWDIDRASKNEFHPTQKPIELFERAIRNHTQSSNIVYDPFLGSGTTLIACERLGRKCMAVEISPAYCAVAIQRWVDMTQGEPKLLDNLTV